MASGTYSFRIATSVCQHEGYEYIVVTDEVIRKQPKLENVKKLWKYARTPVLPQHQILCNAVLQEKQSAEVELGDLIEFFKSRGVGAQVVYAMLFWGVLDFDLTQPLDQFTSIKLTGHAALKMRKAS